MNIEFAYPSFLYLLGVIPVLVLWYFLRSSKRPASVNYVHSAFAEGIKKSIRLRMINLPFALRMLALALLIGAMARPQQSDVIEEVTVEGIDIMIALDISGSMLAEDFSPNRMEAARQTALDFIDLREGDRIGMTVFSGESFTLCPLTTDHALLKQLAAGVTTGMVEDGTAIGDGLATAINRLRDSEAENRVIILLTDGINNTGSIDPITAAEIAALYDIRVYTIGVGSHGPVPYPFETPFGVQYREVEIPVDEELLLQMASMTGAEFFWADSPDTLSGVYEAIDDLETSVIEVTEYTRHQDAYLPLLLVALALLGAETLLKQTWLRTIP